MPGRLEGRIALITGSARGIGKGIARRFAAEGSRVIVNSRNEAHCRETVAEISASGGDARYIIGDVSNATGARGLIAEAAGVHGGLDILVHNAGGTISSPLEDLSDEMLQTLIGTNLLGCFWLSRAVLPFLRAGDAGRILVTSSVAGNRQAIRGLTHYAAAKAGVGGFVRNLALELAPEGITVNSVEPGSIDVERWSDLDPRARDAMLRQVPMGRLGTPDDIGNAMVFFASREADYVTGQCVTVDGGLSLGVARTNDSLNQVMKNRKF